jgi:biotin carboxyl carrier protein
MLKSIFRVKFNAPKAKWGPYQVLHVNKKVGDFVRKNETVMEIDANLIKAVIAEIAPISGTIHEINVKNYQNVKDGQVIYSIKQ